MLYQTDTAKGWGDYSSVGRVLAEHAKALTLSQRLINGAQCHYRQSQKAAAPRAGTSPGYRLQSWSNQAFRASEGLPGRGEPGKSYSPAESPEARKREGGDVWGMEKFLQARCLLPGLASIVPLYRHSGLPLQTAVPVPLGGGPVGGSLLTWETCCLVCAVPKKVG